MTFVFHQSQHACVLATGDQVILRVNFLSHCILFSVFFATNTVVIISTIEFIWWNIAKEALLWHDNHILVKFMVSVPWLFWCQKINPLSCQQFCARDKGKRLIFFNIATQIMPKTHHHGDLFTIFSQWKPQNKMFLYQNMRNNY